MASLSPPATPARQQEHRPRTTSALSFVSNRSRRSSLSGKVDVANLVETSVEKRRLHTKADPSKALNEAQPLAVALEASNLEDIRRMTHKDIEGNVITEPDLSNPTRYRFERPLDTIRAFQAAAEGTSHTRRSTYGGRPASTVAMDTQPRRMSYYGPPPSQAQQMRPRPTPYGSGYYRNASYGGRSDYLSDESPGPVWRGYGPGPVTPPPLRDPSGYHNGRELPTPPYSHQHSYETMTSGSEGENNKSTNPSSLNSSFDHLYQMRNKQEDHANENMNIDIGTFSPVTPPKPFNPYYNRVTSMALQNGNGNTPSPKPLPYNPNNPFRNAGGGPPTPNSIPSQSNALATNNRYARNAPAARPDAGTGQGTPDRRGDLRKTASKSEKRLSWFKRTFTRQEKGISG